jgi:hypothetical protein
MATLRQIHLACAALAALAAAAAVAPAAAQAPQGAPQGAPPSVWADLAPFPQPSEELLGAVANDKLYVFAGLAHDNPGRHCEAALAAEAIQSLFGA